MAVQMLLYFAEQATIARMTHARLAALTCSIILLQMLVDLAKQVQQAGVPVLSEAWSHIIRAGATRKGLAYIR